MAGLGAKKFPAFSKLSSDDVNGYLADQVIMRFATTAARDAAFGGVGEPTLAEGMTAYIDADNSIYTYDGSNWIKMISASQPVGLVLIKTQAMTGSTVVVSDVFSSEYDAYRIVFDGTKNNTGATFINMRFEPSTVAGYNTSFYGQRAEISNGGVFQSTTNPNIGYWVTNVCGDTATVGSWIDLYNPYNAINASFNAMGTDGRTSGAFIRWAAGWHNQTGQYTGFAMSLDNAGSFNGGTVSVYGYR